MIRLDMTRHDFHHLINAMHLKHGVEIGVAHGEFSQYLLRESNLISLWSVDSWEGKYTELIQDAKANLSDFGERSVIGKSPSLQAAKEAADGGYQFDFIYIDASHRMRDVRNDILAWLPLLKRPGIFAGHDYVMGIDSASVRGVVDEFAERLTQPLYLTRERWASWFFILG